MQRVPFIDRVRIRIADILLSLILLVLLSPTILPIAICLSVTGGGRVLERRVVVGRHGRPFNLLRFRTSQDDALSAFVAASRLEGLPQLWNVLLGHMSLVGLQPRRGAHGSARPLEETPGIFWDPTWTITPVSFRLYLHGLRLSVVEILTSRPE